MTETEARDQSRVYREAAAQYAAAGQHDIAERLTESANRIDAILRAEAVSHD
jgi:ribosomal protein L18E